MFKYQIVRSFFLLPLFIFVVSIFSFGIQAHAFSGEGDGLSAETAFIITTCTELQEMNDDLGAYYKLGNNIDCEETETWNENVGEWVGGIVDGTLIDDEYVGVINNGYFGFEPIGQDDVANNSGLGFTGTLDGQGYSIADLWIFRKDTGNVGLIGAAEGATIQNIALSDARIVGQSGTGGFVGYGSNVSLENLTNNTGMVRAYLSYYGGGIAGQLINTSTGTALSVIGGTVHGSGNVIGGLVGSISATTISNSTTTANVDGGEYIGGAFGDVYDSEVDTVSVSGNVESNEVDDLYIPGFSKSGRYTGGFAGRIEDSLIQNVTASSSVTADDDYAGGFAGRIQSSSVSDSAATGNVSGNEYIGGFAGAIEQSNIYDSTATGDVDAAGGLAGGFSGKSLCGSSFLRVSASGDVDSGNSYVGGFTGEDSCDEGDGSTFSQASAHGNVSGNNVVGGFVGYSNASTFVDVYSRGDVIGNGQVGSFASDVTSGNLNNVYARGLVSLYGEEAAVGGFAKDATNSTITSSFWDGESTGQEVACDAGECVGLVELTTIQANTQFTYANAGWDFEDTWGINDTDNDGYPFFRWQGFEHVEEEQEYELLTLSVTDITQTSAILRARVVSGIFVQFGLGFAFAPLPLDDAGDSLLLIGPSDEYDEETGDYMKDLALYEYFDPEDVLTCGTTYYYNAIGFVGMGGGPEDLIAADNELSFTTLACDNVEVVEEPRTSSRSGSRRRSAAPSVNSPFAQTPNVVTAAQDSASISLAAINSGTPSFARNLTLTFTGADVNKLQEILVAKDTGPAARALKANGTTNYFGPLTRAALAEYQAKNGIAPAIGYFGPLSRAQMKAAGLAGLWW